MPPKLDEALTTAWELFCFFLIAIVPAMLVGYILYATWRAFA